MAQETEIVVADGAAGPLVLQMLGEVRDDPGTGLTMMPTQPNVQMQSGATLHVSSQQGGSHSLTQTLNQLGGGLQHGQMVTVGGPDGSQQQYMVVMPGQGMPGTAVQQMQHSTQSTLPPQFLQSFQAGFSGLGSGGQQQGGQQTITIQQGGHHQSQQHIQLQPQGLQIQMQGGQQQGQRSQMGGTVLKQGIVKKWNLEKGYGFIQPVEGGDDVFVHHTVVHAQGFRSLQEQSAVEYECYEREPGRVKATRVTGPGGTFCKAAQRPPNPPLLGVQGSGSSNVPVAWQQHPQQPQRHQQRQQPRRPQHEDRGLGLQDGLAS
eukprot:TRINITY_DN2838_c0_g1_i1.p1 TRINITY_DN2838_c0_g1~~TRINITY_DN2838_c0_g1_i1.p1  ORF type:complete len:319 (+),score=110.13 TRINITY_DN2838_c0_g1_i1:175-1131(+)